MGDEPQRAGSHGGRRRHEAHRAQARGSKHENQIQNHFQLKIKNETGSLLTTVQNTVYTGVPNALVYTGPGQRSAHCLFMGWALVPFSLPKRDRDCRLLDELLRLLGDER